MWIKNLALLAIVLMSQPTLGARQYYDYGQHTHWIGGFMVEGDLVTSVTGCQILGSNYIATTSQMAGLSLFSLVDQQLQEVGNLPLAGTEQDVVFDGEIAYVIAHPNRLAKVLAYVPASPIQQWVDQLPFTPLDIENFGEYLLIACGSSGLLVYDPTEAFNLPIGTVAHWTGVAQEVKFIGSVAVIRTDTGLVTLDLSDPTSPEVLDTFPLAEATGLQVFGQLAYLSVGEDIHELDLADPLAIAHLRTLTGLVDQVGNYPITAMSCTDGGIYYASATRLYHLDLATAQVSWAGTGVYGSQDIALIDDFLGLACGVRGFHGFVQKSPNFAPSSDPVTTVDYLRGRQIDGDFLFGYFASMVYCFDLRGAAPNLAWTYDLGGSNLYGDRLLVKDGRIFLGDNSGQIHILDYTENGATLLTTFPTGNEEIRGLGLLDGHLAVLADPVADVYLEATVLIFDLAEISAIELVGSYTNNNFPYMYARGTTIVLWDHTSMNSGILLLDATDPTNPYPTASVNTPVNSMVNWNGDFLYVVEPPALQAVDISNIHAPILGSPVGIPNGWYLEAHGNTGYLPYTDLVFDLSDPLNPVAVGATSNQFIQRADYAVAGEGYLVTGIGGVLTLMPAHGSALVPAETDPVPAAPTLELLAFPNPFNPRVSLEFSLPADGPAEVDIFDMRGRRIARLGGWFAAGNQAVVWDGRGADGREAPSGVYLARLQFGPAAGLRKLILAR